MDSCGCSQVVPDTGALASARERTEARSAARGRNGDNSSEGNTGLKALGVRELHYRCVLYAADLDATSLSGSKIVMWLWQAGKQFRERSVVQTGNLSRCSCQQELSY